MWIFLRRAAGLVAAVALVPPGPAAARVDPGPDAVRAALARVTGLTPGLSTEESGPGFGVTAVGAGHTCAVVQYADLWCWGANEEGQLGIGSTRDSAVPVRVSATGRLAGTAGIVAVRAGRAHTCALALEYGGAGPAVYCWGGNDEGQLGDGSFVSRARPAQVAADAIQVVTGTDHTCVLSVELTVSCWGRNDVGQLGAGTLGTSEANPQEVPGLTRVIDIAADDDNTCALDETGRAWCWGSDTDGQLGDGGGASGTPSPSPVAVAGGPYAEISVGHRHACALGSRGAAYCWGADDRGQLGGHGEQSAPVRVGARAYALIRAGGDSTCGVTPAGDADCWGANNGGQLGVGDRTDRDTPTAIDRGGIRTSSLARLLNGGPAPMVVDLTVGADRSCAVDASLSVYCTRDGVLRAVPLAPGIVTGVRVAARSGALRVSWSALRDTGADRLAAYVAVAFTGRTLDDSRSCTARPARACTITGLAGDHDYTVVVAAVSHGGISYSALAHGTPTAAGSGVGLPVTGPGPAAVLAVTLLALGWSLLRLSRSIGCRH